jgi:Iodothyronine deiodinase
VYIREAHPIDEWKMAENNDQGICYPQPHTLSQRLAIARDFISRFHYRLALASDTMDNRADFLYGAWPERIYIIDETGRIAYKGKLGPFGFRPEELAALLAKRFPETERSKERFSKDRAGAVR